MCDKIDCWLINHIQQKRNDSIKNFENEKFYFWIKFNFNKKFINELLNIKTKTKTKRFIFSTIWLSILKYIILILIDLKKLNQIRLICINFSFHIVAELGL